MSPSQQESPRHIDQAKENLGDARDALKTGVNEALEAGAAAAQEARAELDEKLQGLLDQGRGMLNQAEDLIRSKPLASFGVAFAAGYLIAALTRRK
ncbi:hypothetical protein [Arenimonas donghaensis]|uniref:DUF883 domain-containing protein n=1 Tax=Arenimonas donghaensis DSM 18148 = HO3-R19 TaxID=1121014 RepID=A0A087MHU8_9GAMM|nr:hypothetical protein [Arenimonas donghaensis]KFL36451.1 hypothetical protein N788_12865 [Arenimonas donghaensis DSM 18148 = HO3-R19]